jgi:hypothetical protein
MAIAEHAIQSGAYSTLGITASTDKRDVSDMLDIWAHKWTPVLNRISWGGESGGLLGVEWLNEHLGFGYVQTCAAIGSDGTAFVVTTSGTGLTTAEVQKCLQPGTVLYTAVSGDSGGGAFLVVTTIATSGTVTISQMVTTSEDIAASAKLYIVGSFANEGSDPFPDKSRKRTILSNNFNILRQDVKITGSQAASDMYAVSDETRHQIAMRLLEMQFERERTVIYSYPQTRTATVAGFMQGFYGFLDGYTAQAWVDASTTSLTEPAFNNLVSECWDNGGQPSTFFANKDIIRLFTQWDQTRVRTQVDAKLAGHYTTRYLTDSGIEVELVPMRKVPKNLAFLIDTAQCHLRAKKGRKMILEKLAKVGDYERWQLLSEYTLEMRNYDMGHHGMFTELA